MTSVSELRLSPRSVPFVLAAVLAAFLLLLAVRGLVDPIGAADGFGVALAAPADAFYLHVKADRDLALAAILVGLLAHRRPLPLALTIGAAILAPVIDGSLVALARGGLGYALAVHGSAAAYGVVTVYVLWRAHQRTASDRAI